MERCGSASRALLAVLVAVLTIGSSPTVAAGPAPTEPAAIAAFVAHATASPAYPGSNIASPFAPLRTLLNATASGGTPPYSFQWDLGDGSNATEQDTVYTYTSAGLYIARLTVRDSEGRESTSTVRIGASSAEGADWVNAEPTPGLGSVPLTVSFAVTGTGDLPTSYRWAFGDGESSDAPAPSHTYTAAGMYVAQVNITGSGGGNATYRMTVFADGAGPLDALGTVSVVGRCNADVWNEASFRAFAGGGNPPYTYSWEFGEPGAVSTAQTPTFSYNASGWFTANLTVVDSTGASATSSISGAAVPPPCPPPPILFVPAGLLVVAAMAAAVTLIILLSRRTRRRDV